MDQESPKKKRRPGMAGEFVYFLKTHKMWWLAPLMLLIVIAGLIMIFGGGQMALTIYALF